MFAVMIEETIISPFADALSDTLISSLISLGHVIPPPVVNSLFVVAGAVVTGTVVAGALVVVGSFCSPLL